MRTREVEEKWWGAQACLCLAALVGCEDAPPSLGGDPLVQVSVDADGWADGDVAIHVQPAVSPGGVVTGVDGSLFVFGTSDVGHGEDAGTNARNVIIKLRSDGTPDPTFGVGGALVSSGYPNRLTKLLVRPDGRLLAIGEAGFMPVVWQLVATGAPDLTFGDESAVSIPFDELGEDGAAFALGAALSDDGRLVLAGQGRAGGLGPLRRFNIAASISSGGVVERPLAFEDATDTWWGVQILDDGAPLVFGERYENLAFRPLVGRLTRTLERDASFSVDGYAKVGVVASYCREPLRRANGGFVAAGSAGAGDTFHGALVAFTAAGDPDTSFNGDGYLPIDTGWVMGIVGLPDGGLLVQLLDEYAPEAVAHVTASGAVDSSYGSGGRSTTDTGAWGFGLVATSSGAMYAAGRTLDTLHLRRPRAGRAAGRQRAGQRSALLQLERVRLLRRTHRARREHRRRSVGRAGRLRRLRRTDAYRGRPARTARRHPLLR